MDRAEMDARSARLIELYGQEPRLTLDQIGEAMGYKEGPNRKRVVNAALWRLRKKGHDIPFRSDQVHG